VESIKIPGKNRVHLWKDAGSGRKGYCVEGRAKAEVRKNKRWKVVVLCLRRAALAKATGVFFGSIDPCKKAGIRVRKVGPQGLEP
jgi:hypothetical protein